MRIEGITVGDKIFSFKAMELLTVHSFICWLFKGSAPTISVDNTGGCLLYLSKDSLGTSITTAKSSEINVLVPHAGSDGDWVWSCLPSCFMILIFFCHLTRFLNSCIHSSFPFLLFNLLRNIYVFVSY